MKPTDLNIVIINESEKYLGDDRVKWCYENLYSQYGKNFEVKLENNKVIIYGSIMVPGIYDKLPYKIDEVYGNVIVDNFQENISGNITTLQNFPTIIHGDFVCRSNPKLLTLDNGPEIVDGDFNCASCGLTDISQMPKYIGGNFYVFCNKIEDLQPIKKSNINGSIDIQFNPCENSETYRELKLKYKISES